MSSTFYLIISLSIISSAFQRFSKITPIKDDNTYSGSIKSSVEYFISDISTDKQGKTLDVIIESQITQKNNEQSPVLLVSQKPLPNSDKQSHLLCEGFGVENTCRIPADFIRRSSNHKVNIALFCKECEYSIKLSFVPSEPKSTGFRQLNSNLILGTGRKLQDESTSKRNKFNADGLGALFIAFVIIFVVIAACNIMMNIYVHTSKLVDQPLKLGRVDE